MNIKIEYKANNTRDDRFAYPEHQRPFPPSLNRAVCLQSMAAAGEELQAAEEEDFPLCELMEIIPYHFQLKQN